MCLESLDFGLRLDATDETLVRLAGIEKQGEGAELSAELTCCDLRRLCVPKTSFRGEGERISDES